MKWISVKEKLPEKGKLVLTYSPRFTLEDMTFRLMNSEFVHMLDSVKYWMYLEKPEGENQCT